MSKQEENQRKVREMALNLLKNERFAIVTTIDVHGNPHSRVMFNLRDHNGFDDIASFFLQYDESEEYTMFFSTNTSSAKLNHIEKNSIASVVVSRNEDFLGVSLLGKMKIIEDANVRESLWFKGSERYYPTTGKSDDPDYTILKFEPFQLEWWGAGFKEKFEL